jgi:hypothetical protein
LPLEEDKVVKSPISPPLACPSSGGRGLSGGGRNYLNCCFFHPHLHPVKSPKGGRQRRHLTGQALSHPWPWPGRPGRRGRGIFTTFYETIKESKSYVFAIVLNTFFRWRYPSSELLFNHSFAGVPSARRILTFT